MLIAAADCTGHGVPGAFMSMLGISQLNEIMKNNVEKPNEVLNELRERIKFSLHQEGQKGQTLDGMDIALCFIDLDSKKLFFSGAYNPLYLIRKKTENDSFELLEIKADRMPIGVHPKDNKEFNYNEIQLKENDSIYLFSDGFTSQFGGDKKEKFKTKRFQETLVDIQNLPMHEQGNLLINQLAKWQGFEEQTDDILVIGIKIN